jgi:hypothetical protein
MEYRKCKCVQDRSNVRRKFDGNFVTSFSTITGSVEFKYNFKIL